MGETLRGDPLSGQPLFIECAIRAFYRAYGRHYKNKTRPQSFKVAAAPSYPSLPNLQRSDPFILKILYSTNSIQSRETKGTAAKRGSIAAPGG